MVVVVGNDHLIRIWLAPEAGWRAADAPTLVATEKVVQGGEPWQDEASLPRPKVFGVVVRARPGALKRH